MKIEVNYRIFSTNFLHELLSEAINFHLFHYSCGYFGVGKNYF